MPNVSESIIAQINQQTAENVFSVHDSKKLDKGDKALLQTDTLSKSEPASSKYEGSVPNSKPVLIQPQKATETTNYLKAEVAAFVAAFLSDKSSVSLSNSSLSEWTKLINTSSKCAIETTNSLIKKQKIQLQEYNKELAKEKHDEHVDKILSHWTLGLSIAIAVLAIGATVISGGASAAGIGAAEAVEDTGAEAATQSIGRRLVSFICRNAVKILANTAMSIVVTFVMNSPKLVEYLQKQQIGAALRQQAETEKQVGVLQASFSRQNEYLQYDGTQASVAGQLIQQLVQQLTGPITNIGDVTHAVQSAISRI